MFLGLDGTEKIDPDLLSKPTTVHPVTRDLGDMGRAIRMLDPKRIAFATDSTGPEWQTNKCTQAPSCKNLTKDYACKFLPQYVKARKCFGLIEEYESQMGWKYDFVVHSRPDMVWMTDTPITLNKCPDSPCPTNKMVTPVRHPYLLMFNTFQPGSTANNPSCPVQLLKGNMQQHLRMDNRIADQFAVVPRHLASMYETSRSICARFEFCCS